MEGKNSWRSDETHGETQKWSERDAISRPYLVIMSPCFKVQSVPVMLLHNCALGEFPHRSDDKKTSARSMRGAPSHSLWDTFQKYDKSCLRSLLFVPIDTQLLTGGPGGKAFRRSENEHSARTR